MNINLVIILFFIKRINSLQFQKINLYNIRNKPDYYKVTYYEKNVTLTPVYDHERKNVNLLPIKLYNILYCMKIYFCIALKSTIKIFNKK